jgi:DNA-binding NarL/FixJ family response regulator
MGKELNLSPRTVEDYRLNALRKLGVASTSAAIRIGLEAGLRASGAMSDAPGRVTALS